MFAGLVRTMALAARSLRLDLRVNLLHWLRGGFAAALLIAVIYVQSTAEDYGAPGQRIFVALIEINYYFIWVLAVGLFATVISEEREEGALPLLQMAGMNRLSILFGKSSGYLVTAISLLAVQLPFAMFTVTLGGVSSQQVFSAFGLLFVYLLFTYSVGLFASALCMRTSRAMQLTFGILFVYSWVPSLVEKVLARVTAVTEASAAHGLERVAAIDFVEGELALPVQVLSVLAVLFFVAAFLALDLRRELADTGTERGGWRFWRPFRGRRPSGRAAAAIAWKDEHWLRGGRRGAVVRMVLYIAVPSVLIYTSGFSSFEKEWTILLGVTGFYMLLCIAVDMAFLGSQLFRAELRADTLDTLLMLPDGLAAVRRGKRRLVLRTVWRGVALALLLLTIGSTSRQNRIGPQFLEVGCVYLAGMYALFQLTTLASLVLRRGAFPITLFGFALFSVLVGAMTQHSTMVIGLVSLGIGVAAQLLIGPALVRAAGLTSGG